MEMSCFSLKDKVAIVTRGGLKAGPSNQMVENILKSLA